ncbi:MAG: hypothetical protein F6J90_10420 [Moorea sp. SIOASIH]|nr:hypothetical protein [Moorena sp. SIOASIH]
MIKAEKVRPVANLILNGSSAPALMHVNFCLLPLASCLARSAIIVSD